MRKLITSSVGIICGIAIIIMAFFVKAAPVEFEDASLVKLAASSAYPLTVPDERTGYYESDKYYGGDAYSGIQQAAAQAANNILAMEETLLQTNQNIQAVNENLQIIEADLVDANNNMIKAAKHQQENMQIASQGVSSAISKAACFLLLAMGLITIVNHLPAFVESLGSVLAEKKAASMAAEVQKEVAPEEETAPEEEAAPEEEVAPEEEAVLEKEAVE